jgi:hypothetical protein
MLIRELVDPWRNSSRVARLVPSPSSSNSSGHSRGWSLHNCDSVRETSPKVVSDIETVPSYSVSVHNTGASLILVLPAAFVALDESSMNSRRTIERLRIIAAGAFHNIACYALLLSCTWLRLGSITLKALGYSNVSQSGLVVIGIELVRRILLWLLMS